MGFLWFLTFHVGSHGSSAWTRTVSALEGWRIQPWLAGGIPTHLKHMKVNWDDDIPNWMGKWKMFETTNQMSWGLLHIGFFSPNLMFIQAMGWFFSTGKTEKTWWLQGVEAGLVGSKKTFPSSKPLRKRCDIPKCWTKMMNPFREWYVVPFQYVRIRDNQKIEYYALV